MKKIFIRLVVAGLCILGISTCMEQSPVDGFVLNPAAVSSQENVVASGRLDGNEEITWEILEDENNIYSIIFSGAGALYNGGNPVIPNEYASRIEKCIVMEGITKIGDNAFYYCNGLKTVSLPDTILEIGFDAFCRCTNLNDVVIPKGVEKIKMFAFEGCYGLENLSLSGTISEIEWGAFSGCTNLNDVIIPEGVKYIRGEAFWGFSNNLYLPNSIVSIGDDILGSGGALVFPEGHDLFETICNKDEYKNKCFEKGKNYKFSVGNSLNANFDYSTRRVTYYGTGSPYNNYACPYEDIVKIVDYSNSDTFISCHGYSLLCEVILPKNCTEIPYGAFWSCGNLTKIKFSDNLEEIGDNAFCDCISLKEVTLPETVKKIGYCAFSSCYSLKNIKLSESLVEIGQYAFEGCEFEKIVIPRNVCKISPKTFVIGTNNLDIYFLSNKVVIPKKFVERYPGHEGTIKIHGYSNVREYVESENVSYIVYANLCEEGIHCEERTVCANEKEYRIKTICTECGKYSTKVDTSFTSLAQADNGCWYDYVNGKVSDYTGLRYYAGAWWYVEKGKVNFNTTTLCQYGGTWWYVEKGKVNFSATTLCQYGGSWWYVEKGKVNFSATTLCQYGGSWWYVEKGKVNFSATTLCQYGGSWWYVQKGKVNFGATTLCNYGGSWWYVQKGKVNFGATTLCQYGGTWWYVEKGKVNFNATTLCNYGGKWWYVQKGKVNFGATTLCKYSGTWWYVEKGVVNFNYTGYFKYYGTNYRIVKGVVKF